MKASNVLEVQLKCSFQGCSVNLNSTILGPEIEQNGVFLKFFLGTSSSHLPYKYVYLQSIWSFKYFMRGGFILSERRSLSPIGFHRIEIRQSFVFVFRALLQIKLLNKKKWDRCLKLYFWFSLLLIVFNLLFPVKSMNFLQFDFPEH